MSNSARRCKESILADTEELIKVLDPAILTMPKIRRLHGAAIRMETAAYDLIDCFHVAYNCPEARLEYIQKMFGTYGRMQTAFSILLQQKQDCQKSSNKENVGSMGLFTLRASHAIARQMERIKEGIKKYHSATKNCHNDVLVGTKQEGTS